MSFTRYRWTQMGLTESKKSTRIPSYSRGSDEWVRYVDVAALEASFAALSAENYSLKALAAQRARECDSYRSVRDLARNDVFTLRARVAALEASSAATNPLGDLAAQTRAINVANGWGVLQPSDWEDEHKVPAILALIHSEVSEALEEFRTGDLAAFREELADVLIRVLDAAAGLGIDLDAEVGAKLEKNRSRGFRHGGKRV